MYVADIKNEVMSRRISVGGHCPNPYPILLVDLPELNIQITRFLLTSSFKTNPRQRKYVYDILQSRYCPPRHL